MQYPRHTGRNNISSSLSMSLIRIGGLVTASSTIVGASVGATTGCLEEDIIGGTASVGAFVGPAV